MPVADPDTEDLLARAYFVLRSAFPSHGPSIGQLLEEIRLALPCDTCERRGCEKRAGPACLTHRKKLDQQ